MNNSLLMKRGPVKALMAAAIVAAPLTAGMVYASMAIPAAKQLNAYSVSVSDLQEKMPLMLQAKGNRFSAPANPAKAPAAIITDGVEAEVIIDENFANWTEGTQEDPSTVAVTDEQVESLMSYKGDWTLFRVYEAGGAAYMDFDMVGKDGPGYIMTPSLDLMEGKEGYYRVSCRVKNVNENSQDAQFQIFVMDETISTMIAASAQPMEYQEWVECEWVGAVVSAKTSFMLFGWQGEILMDRLKVEKLTYPLAKPTVNGATLNEDGSVTVSWDKVEGATGYFVQVQEGMQAIISEEVGDVDSCNMTFDINLDESYTVYVTALAEGKCSYYGYKNVNLVPEYIGEAVALEATDVTEEGFTANWERAAYASQYLVLPTLTHTATADGEEFYILNELFANVPEEADMNAPIQVAPMLGMDGTDLYMSRAGWSIDMGMFVRMMPDMPLLALTNQYAAYGLEGSLTSPVTDFSVGNGTVKVAGMGLSSVDDVVMTCGFLNEDGEMYASADFELTTDGDMFEVEVSGGEANSRLVIKMTDSAEGGDMVLLPMLSVTTTLNEGETITVPAETVFAGNVTSQRVEALLNKENLYSYQVQGYKTAALMGEVSNAVKVDTPVGVESVASGCVAKVVPFGGTIRIVNPSAEVCEVFTLDGKRIYSSAAASFAVNVEKGSYLVKVGNATFKVAL